MAIEALSKLADFRLVDASQDIRGRPLYDRDGNRLGVIDELLVDTDQQLVRWVRLEDGRRVATEAVNIEEGGVFVDRPIKPSEPTRSPEHSHPPRSPVDHPPPDYPPPPGERAP